MLGRGWQLCTSNVNELVFPRIQLHALEDIVLLDSSMSASPGKKADKHYYGQNPPKKSRKGSPEDPPEKPLGIP